MIGTTDDEIRARMRVIREVDAGGWEFLATTDQRTRCVKTSTESVLPAIAS